MRNIAIAGIKRTIRRGMNVNGTTVHVYGCAPMEDRVTHPGKTDPKSLLVVLDAVQGTTKDEYVSLQGDG